VQLINGNGKVTTFTYDTAGRLQTTVDPLSRVTTLSYDGANDVTGKQDARPLLATFSYDPNNRNSGATYPGYVATFQYDPLGNRALAQNPVGSYITTFTNRSQVGGSGSCPECPLFPIFFSMAIKQRGRAAWPAAVRCDWPQLLLANCCARRASCRVGPTCVPCRFQRR
jgi:YD repeat-containing protein